MSDLTRRHLFWLCGAAGLSSLFGDSLTFDHQEPSLPIPTNLRITGTASSYFDALAERPDCVSALAMGSAAEIDATPPRNFPYDAVRRKKRPVVYDPVMKAAMYSVHAPESTDTQQKYWPIRMPPGHSMFLLWDFRLDENWAWRKAGNLVRHKAFQLNARNAAPWLTIRTFYPQASPKYVAELAITSNSQNFLFPGFSFRGEREMIEPRLSGSTFYVPADTWCRLAFHCVDIGPTTPHTNVSYSNGVSVAAQWPDGRLVEMSSWMAHERYGPVQVHDSVRIVQPYRSGLVLSRLEFDAGGESGSDVATNPNIMYGWQRYLICLLDPTDKVSTIVRRPVP